MKVFEVFGTPVVNGFKVGCEFEVENIVGGTNSSYFPSNSIQITTDHSLRGDGAREFITSPVDIDKAVEIHKNIYHKLLKFEGDHSSDRTSIHAHVNFSDMDTNKVHQFILLYALYEPLFFKMVASERQNNIFCVPLSFTSLNKYYSYADVGVLTSKWSKYAAFNIIPLGKHGTIEFRHLQGTEDTKLFERWLCTIKNLYDLNLTINLKQMIQVPGWVQEQSSKIFGSMMLSYGELNKLLENSTLDVQLAYLDPDKKVLNERLKHNLLELS